MKTPRIHVSVNNEILDSATVRRDVAIDNTIPLMDIEKIMTALGREIRDGEYVNIELTIQTIEDSGDKVAYRAWCKDSADETVILTVFSDNEPDIAIEEGERYRFINVRGDNWENDPGVMFRPKSTVQRVSERNRGEDYLESAPTPEGEWSNSRENTESSSQAKVEPREKRPATNGHDIVEDEYVDIILTVENIETVEDESVLYRAWSTDRNGETVIVTVFGDNRPSLSLSEGTTYLFEDVRGERWDDGTPGVIFRPNSSVAQLDVYEDADDSPVGTKDTRNGKKPSSRDEKRDEERSSQKDLIIDAVRQSPTESPSWREKRIPPSAGVAISAGVTGVAIFSSLFATSMGTTGKAVVLLVGSAIAAGGTYVSTFEPSSKLRQRRKEKHARLFLEILLQDYYQLTEGPESARANIMIPEKSYLGSGGKLSILAATGEYDDSELDEEYDLVSREGPWTRAFTDETIELYDTQEKPEAGADLSAGQRKILEDLESSLSVPIYSEANSDRTPLGVLNLDSTASLSETKFDDDEVRRVCVRYRELLGEVLE